MSMGKTYQNLLKFHKTTYSCCLKVSSKRLSTHIEYLKVEECLKLKKNQSTFTDATLNNCNINIDLSYTVIFLDGKKNKMLWLFRKYNFLLLLPLERFSNCIMSLPREIEKKILKKLSFSFEGSSKSYLQLFDIFRKIGRRDETFVSLST